MWVASGKFRLSNAVSAKFLGKNLPTWSNRFRLFNDDMDGTSATVFSNSAVVVLVEGCKMVSSLLEGLLRIWSGRKS